MEDKTVCIPLPALGTDLLCCIRPVRRADVDALVAVYAAGQRTYVHDDETKLVHDTWFEDTQPELRALPESYVHADGRPRAFWVAVAPAHAVHTAGLRTDGLGHVLVPAGEAYVILGMVACVPAALEDAPPTLAELQRMCVHPELRGCGLGRALVAHAHTWAIERGFTRIRLTTLYYMPWRFYRKLGYVCVCGTPDVEHMCTQPLAYAGTEVQLVELRRELHG